MIPKIAIVVDLETLGLKPTSAVTELAAVAINLDNGQIITRYYTALNVDDQVRNGATVQHDTIAWMMSNITPRRVEAGVKIDNVRRIYAYHDWIRQLVSVYGDVALYGNGANFDHPIYENLLTTMDITVDEKPWAFYKELCMRTITQLVPSGIYGVAKIVAEQYCREAHGSYVKHNPEHDVSFEAIVLYECVKHLREAQTSLDERALVALDNVVPPAPEEIPILATEDAPLLAPKKKSRGK